MSYYIDEVVEGFFRLLKKEGGDDSKLLAIRNGGIWRAFKDDPPRSRQFVDPIEITEEEAVMILFQAKDPVSTEIA